GLLLQRVAELVLAREVDEAFHKRLEDLLVDVDPFDAAAGLAGIEVAAVDQVLDRELEVGIRAHVGGILAAELEAGGDEAPGGGLLDGVAAGNRTGEGDESDARVGDGLRHLVVAQVQELEHAVGQADGLERLGIALGDQRRLRRHLEDHAVAGNQRGQYGVYGSEPRVIPRCDDENDTKGFSTNEAAKSGFLGKRNIGKSFFGDAAHIERALVEAALELAGRLGDG